MFSDDIFVNIKNADVEDKTPVSIIIFKQDCSKIYWANNIFAKSENTQTEDLLYTDLSYKAIREQTCPDLGTMVWYCLKPTTALMLVRYPFSISVLKHIHIYFFKIPLLIMNTFEGPLLQMFGNGCIRVTCTAYDLIAKWSICPKIDLIAKQSTSNWCYSC